MAVKSLEDWKWCDRLTVVEAAMLAVELDPTEIELVGSPLDYEGKFHLIGADTLDHTYSRHPRFVTVFRAIRSAVLRGEIKAEFIYAARTVHPASFFDPNPLDEPQNGELLLPSEFVIKAIEHIDTNVPADEHSEIIFFTEPDWRRTSVSVDVLRSWMASKGQRPAFYFPERERAEDNDFMDSNHDHFSPELSLAVKAWTALASTRTHRGGPKASISRWLDEHPEEWQGEGDAPSGACKERLTIVVNWNKSGGATRTLG